MHSVTLLNIINMSHFNKLHADTYADFIISYNTGQQCERKSALIFSRKEEFRVWMVSSISESPQPALKHFTGQSRIANYPQGLNNIWLNDTDPHTGCRLAFADLLTECLDMQEHT